MSKVNELIQQYTDDAIEIRRHIHRHPELSMEEKNTTEFITGQSPKQLNSKNGEQNESDS